MFRDRVDAGRHLADLVLAPPGACSGAGSSCSGCPGAGSPSPPRWRGHWAHRSTSSSSGSSASRSSPSWRWAPSARTAFRWRTRTSWDRPRSTASTSKRWRGGNGRSSPRRARRYREDRPRLDLRGRCAVIVDDGIATGSTARAACRVARAHGAARIVLAVAVAPQAAVCGPARRVRRLRLRGASRTRSTPWASGTTTSPRRPTARWSSCSAGSAQP